MIERKLCGRFTEAAEHNFQELSIIHLIGFNVIHVKYRGSLLLRGLTGVMTL